MKIRVKCLVRRFVCLKYLHLLFRLETLLQRLEVRWSVFRELHGHRNLRAAILSEVLIVGGLIVTTKARRTEGDNYTTLLLRLSVSTLEYWFCPGLHIRFVLNKDMLSKITYIELVFSFIFNFYIH